MRILVTGANGYLGLGIVKKLLDDGMEVIVTDFSVDRCDKRAILMPCNLFEIENPYDYFDKPDVVLHLAWKDGFVHNSDSHIFNIPHHYNFLKKIFESNVKRVAIMGSMHEVGFYEGSVDEKSECNPMSLYGIAKNTLRFECEYLSRKNNKKMQWLRGYYIVGNTYYGCSVFSKIVQAVKEGKKKFPFTMGLNQFDFLDYNEFCEQVSATIEQDDITGIINICSGRPEKLAVRVERFIKENGYDIKLQYGAFHDRAYDSKAVWGNDNKINKIMQGYNK